MRHPGYSTDRTFRLEPRARERLAEAFAVDDGSLGEMCSEVQRLLSQYPSMTEARDRAPRPSRRLALLEEGKALSERLVLWLRLDPAQALGDLAMAGFGPTKVIELADILEQLAEAAERAAADVVILPARHGPTRRARNQILNRLAHVFDYFFAQTPDALKRPLYDVQQLKIEFLSDALAAAKIPCPRFAAHQADTSATSRLARMAPPRCGACWQSGQHRRHRKARPSAAYRWDVPHAGQPC